MLFNNVLTVESVVSTFTVVGKIAEARDVRLTTIRVTVTTKTK